MTLQQTALAPKGGHGSNKRSQKQFAPLLHHCARKQCRTSKVLSLLRQVPISTLKKRGPIEVAD